MEATISVICYKSKTLKNGEHSLMLRITQFGKSTYKSKKFRCGTTVFTQYHQKHKINSGQIHNLPT